MRFLFSLTLFLLIGWSAGLLSFVYTMPAALTPPTEKADAIVVLTGGNGRVEHGFEMLAEGAAPILFISGVGGKGTLSEMLAAHASPATREAIQAKGGAIVLGHAASTTRTNAAEVAEFAKGRNLQSIRLVTAHYHMPRSLLEFRYALPEIGFIADPVFPKGFQRSEWWHHQNTRHLLLSEYHKFIVARFRPLLS